MSKIILKNDVEIKKAAERDLEGIKIRNIHNPLFSELDLIEEAEFELNLFKKKKYGIFSKVMYKLASLFSVVDENDVDSRYELYFNKALCNSLRENIVMKEVDRLHKLHTEKNLEMTLRDVEYMLHSKEIIAYLIKQKVVYKKSFFNAILEKIENGHFPDFKGYGNGRIKKIKREWKELIKESP